MLEEYFRLLLWLQSQKTNYFKVREEFLSGEAPRIHGVRKWESDYLEEILKIEDLCDKLCQIIYSDRQARIVTRESVYILTNTEPVKDSFGNSYCESHGFQPSTGWNFLGDLQYLLDGSCVSNLNTINFKSLLRLARWSKIKPSSTSILNVSVEDYGSRLTGITGLFVESCLQEGGSKYGQIVKPE